MFLIFDINKLHIIWILILVYLLSLTKYAFRIGIILFNLMCLILKKQNVVNDKDNILFPDSASNQKDAEAYSNRGNSKVELEDYRGAIQDYNKAIKINPNYAEPYSNRGNSKGELEDYGGAIQDYNKAIKINPNYAKAYITRGNAKYILGDKESACSDWAKAAKLGITQASELIKEYCK